MSLQNIVEVVRPGLLTTMQDAGRPGYLHLGLPRSGCMDSYSQNLANYLVGNDLNATVLEVTLQGPELVFNTPVNVGVAGAHFDIYINDILQTPHVTWSLQRGDCLRFGRLHSGCRAYLAVSAGFVVKPVLQSCSTFLLSGIGGHQGRALEAGDRLVVGDSSGCCKVKSLSKALLIDYKIPKAIRVVAGPESHWFSDKNKQDFFSEVFYVLPESNRMGYRLNTSKPLCLEQKQSMLTTAIVPGTIQVPDNGKPIVVLADGQTSGGYPRIASIISADLHLLGQYKPGDAIRFFVVNAEEAVTIYRDKQRLLKTALAYRT